MKLRLVSVLTLFLAWQAQAQSITYKYYRLYSACGDGSKVATIQNNNAGDGARLVIGPTSGTSSAQQFRLERLSNGNYSVISRLSGKALDVYEWSTDDNAAIVQWTNYRQANQQFRMQKNADGTTSFQASHSGKYIDLSGAITTSGNPFVQYTGNGTCAQKFRVIAVSSPTTTTSTSTTTTSAPTTTTTMAVFDSRNIQVQSVATSAATVRPGDSLTVRLTLNYSGSVAPPSGMSPFIHFVSPANSTWFEFSLFPVPGPASSTWKGVMTFEGSVQVPFNASGTYNILVGVNDGSTSNVTANIRLSGAAGVSETFGAGAIGYRYQAGSMNVSSVSPTTNSLPTQLTLLPLGDSLTAGSDYIAGSYRTYRGTLYSLLKARIPTVDFLGVKQDDPAVGGDPDNAAWGGAWIGPGGSTNNIDDRLDWILSSVGQPQVIVVSFGWNSVYNEPFQSASKYTALINRIRGLRPEALIVVATLPPQIGETEAQSSANVQGYRDFNTAARNLANASATDRIVLADLAALGGYQPQDYWDVIHLFQSGSDKSARVIADAIFNYYSGTAAAAIGTGTSASTSSTVSGYTFQTLIDDMNKLSDWRAPINPGPYDPGVVMGSSMRGGAMAQWMLSSYPGLQQFVPQVFPYIQPWYTLLAGEGNLDGSTYVEIRNDVTYVLYSNGQWSPIYNPMEQVWQGNWNGYDNQISVVQQPSGSKSFLIPGNTGEYIHGGTGRFRVANPQDIIAVHHRLEARLVMSASSYDRNRTRRMMQVGTDFLPENIDAWNAVLNWYVPSSSSRSREITPQWQVYTTTSVKPTVNGLPNSVVHPPYDSSIKNYITEDELRANPPPGF